MASAKLALFKVCPGHWYSLIAVFLSGILLSQIMAANSSLFRAKVSLIISKPSTTLTAAFLIKVIGVETNPTHACPNFPAISFSHKA